VKHRNAAHDTNYSYCDYLARIINVTDLSIGNFILEKYDSVGRTGLYRRNLYSQLYTLHGKFYSNVGHHVVANIYQYTNQVSVKLPIL